MSRRSVSALHRASRNVIVQFMNESKRNMAQINQRIAAVKAQDLEIQLLLMTLMSKLGGIYSHSWIATWDSTPKLCIHTYRADSFKDPRVLDALALLNGSFPECETEDYAAALNREYRFKSERLCVTLDVSVRSDSPTCRKVKIGEELRTYTDTKYRIECD